MALLTIVLLILLNGLFAMSEMAVIASRRARLRERVDAGDRRATAALELHNAPNVFLSTIQVGITTVGVLLGAVGERMLAADVAAWLGQMPALAPYANAAALGLVVVGITYFSLVAGELVPKRLALYHPETIARVVARPMRLLSRLTYPAVQVLSASVDLCLKLLHARAPAGPTITEEEIRSMIEEGTRAGVLLKAEQDLLTNVIRFADRSISTLMTPRSEAVWLDLNDAPEVNRRKIAESPHGRFPVARESLDHVVGVVQSKDLLTRVLSGQPFDIEAAARPVQYVPDSASPLQVLEMFRTTPEHMALVVDEYGEVRGLVTLTGVLEAIVGALPAPGAPPEPKIVRRADGSWLLDGMLSVVELKDALHIPRLPEEEEAGYETLAGFVLSQLGRIPHIGDTFVWNDLRFEIVDMDANRIDRVLVMPLPPGPRSAAPVRPRDVKLHVGCCGWALSQRQYFSTFRVLEVQQTFYEPPRLATLQKWRARSPPGFQFTLKAWQLITHEPSSPTYRRLKTPIPEGSRSRYGAFRQTDEVHDAWRTTLGCARALDARIVVFQCPAAFAPTAQHIENLRRFFSLARGQAEDLTFAWEPRGDWSDRQVRALCGEFGLVHVVDPFVRRTVTPRLQYYRLHGIGAYRHTYSDAELAQLAGWCRAETYVMFNNMTMAQDALRFAQMHR